MENDILEGLLSDDTGERFKVLVCIDGTEESYRGLRYAVRLASGIDTDLTLLYVRKADSELSSGGLDMRMTRENMLDWGLELPGMDNLKRGLDILMEMSYLDGSWCSESSHVDIKGDPLGSNQVRYTNDEGRKVTLKLMVAPSAEIGILDESDGGHYNITIVSAGDSTDDSEKNTFFAKTVSQRIATESHGSVIVAKGLEENQGHLICLNGSDCSLKTALNDAIMAARCNCKIYLYTVVAKKSKKYIAQAIIDEARTVIERAGYCVEGEIIGYGNVVDSIIEDGSYYSMIVLCGEHGKGISRFLKSSINTQVLDGAKNSVMFSR